MSNISQKSKLSRESTSMVFIQHLHYSFYGLCIFKIKLLCESKWI